MLSLILHYTSSLYGCITGNALVLLEAVGETSTIYLQNIPFAPLEIEMPQPMFIHCLGADREHI